MSRVGADEVWPDLPLDGWQDTYDTLHMWSQVVGKTSLALAPMVNHWWQVAYHVTPRGLRTPPLPYQNGLLEIEFDFVDHQLLFHTSSGMVEHMRLAPRSVADFYAEYIKVLGELGVDAKIYPKPVEVAESIPFAEDRRHSQYDRDAVERWWRIMLQSSEVFEEFRGGFLGKASPVHFFWGGFDLAVTLFSGRTAPRHGGGMPNCPDYVMIEAESHENFSAGFWPGSADAAVKEPVFYAYAYPEPAGTAGAPLRPAGARYDTGMREFILPYGTMRASTRPRFALLEFLQSAYAVSADLGSWNRKDLERQSPLGR